MKILFYIIASVLVSACGKGPDAQPTPPTVQTVPVVGQTETLFSCQSIGANFSEVFSFDFLVVKNSDGSIDSSCSANGKENTRHYSSEYAAENESYSCQLFFNFSSERPYDLRIDGSQIEVTGISVAGSHEQYTRECNPK